MKLRNKRTGEIGYFCFANWNDPALIIMDDNGVQLVKYDSLAKLNANWEDAPEEYWYIACCGDVENDVDEGAELDKGCKEIGNYFNSQEEAEKAVERLKAWKLLKDKGFNFTGYTDRDRGKDGQFEIYCDFRNGKEPVWQTEVDPLLDLLFGGEE